MRHVVSGAKCSSTWSFLSFEFLDLLYNLTDNIDNQVHKGHLPTEGRWKNCRPMRQLLLHYNQILQINQQR